MQQIIDVAESLGRKVALSGRSLENVVSIAAEMGYIRIPDGILIGIDSINRYPADKLVIITTAARASRCQHFTEWRFPSTDVLLSAPMIM